MSFACPRPRFAPIAAVTAAGAVLGLLSCDGSGPAGPEEPDRVEITFDQPVLDLGEATSGTVTLRNAGTAPVGPVQILAEAVTLEGSQQIPGVEMRADPDQVPTLSPGSSREISLHLEGEDALPAGSYSVRLTARSPGDGAQAEVEVRFSLACADAADAVASLEILPPEGPLRQGDPVRMEVLALDAGEAAVARPCLSWSVVPADAGVVVGDGRFVGYRPGRWTLEVRSGTATDAVFVDVESRGLPEGSFTVVGEGPVDRHFTSDLWVWEDVAYTGTWGVREVPGEGSVFGNSLHAWDVSDPSAPVHTHTVEVDARTVNDVKIRDDGQLAVMTHEISNDGLNGITLLDMSDPFRPTPITRFTQGLESGVHNVWIEGDHVYLAVNGLGNGLRVLDVADPASPRLVASFYGGSSFLHDVYVRDGLAFLSHWNAGLVILDAGHGIRGGSPSNPVEVGRVRTRGGRTHNAWYWPETGYVFVGEENFNDPGVMHVVDASDLANPREVATFRVPGHTPHNFWLDENRGILYMAWYGKGVRAVDVTGELLGELERQGREISGFVYAEPGPEHFCAGNLEATCTWAPQLHRGDVHVSDMNRGLLVLRPDF